MLNTERRIGPGTGRDGQAKTLLKTMLGSRADWRLDRFRAPRIGTPDAGWIGSLLILASVVAAWVPFQGAQGDGPVAFGLYIGAVSIILMAWSFILAVRIRMIESLFGGLDRVYRVHRWVGTLSILAMVLHTGIEPDIQGGILGAAENVADNATDLAETAEVMFYGLIAASLLRWLPYRWWRLTHKLLGIPFVFACWHFYTAEKTYANGSGWGWYFGLFMLAGIAAWVARVAGRDIIARGVPYRIVEKRQTDTVTELVLRPTGRRSLQYHAGQFAFIKVQAPGMSEPHALTIASAPESGHLRFFIRDLGDWTSRLRTMDLVGTDVIVEGPYGRFEPFGRNEPTVWVAGGVGITPFLAVLDGSTPQGGTTPHLFYSVRSRDAAMALDVLEEAAAAGRVHLHVFASAEGNRLTTAALTEAVPGGLRGAHVAMCGPAGLVDDVSSVARAAGAARVETEDFDIRQGFGPEISRELDALVSGWRG